MTIIDLPFDGGGVATACFRGGVAHHPEKTCVRTYRLRTWRNYGKYYRGVNVWVYLPRGRAVLVGVTWRVPQPFSEPCVTPQA